MALYALLATITLLVIVSVWCSKIFLRKSFGKLRDELIVITGASSGIGHQLAIDFWNENCKLVLIDKSLDILENFQEELLKMHPSRTPDDIQCHFADLADVSSISKTFQSILNKFGKVPIRILINCAGVSMRADSLDMGLQDDLYVMNVNFHAPVELTREVVAKSMSLRDDKQNPCMIVNISSIGALLPMPSRSTYAASKAALDAYSEVVRVEFQPLNIDVLVVNPAFVRTNIAKNAIKGAMESDPDIERGLSVENVSQRILDAVKRRKAQITIYSSPIMPLAVIAKFACPCIYRYGMPKWMELKHKKTI